MKKRIIYRKPRENQDRFIIATVHKKTKNIRRGLELCKEMHVNRVDFSEQKEEERCTIACKEVAMDYRLSAEECDQNVQRISMVEGMAAPEKLRRDVFFALVSGCLGIKYDSVFDGGIDKNSERGPLFHYMEDMNYRIEQYGRTLMALTNVAVYAAEDVSAELPEVAAFVKPLTSSNILAEQELPAGLVIGEFVDTEGNAYLMYQNADCGGQTPKAFQLKLKKPFRVYRVNPHTGQQVLVKDNQDVQVIRIMPGDGDLLRYQDMEAEACLIEYALKK